MHEIKKRDEKKEKKKENSEDLDDEDEDDDDDIDLEEGEYDENVKGGYDSNIFKEKEDSFSGEGGDEGDDFSGEDLEDFKKGANLKDQDDLFAEKSGSHEDENSFNYDDDDDFFGGSQEEYKYEDLERNIKKGKNELLKEEGDSVDDNLKHLFSSESFSEDMDEEQLRKMEKNNIFANAEEFGEILEDAGKEVKDKEYYLEKKKQGKRKTIQTKKDSKKRGKPKRPRKK